MKEPESDDPMLLAGTSIPGNPLFLARCVTEEFARIGFGPDELFALFSKPVYPMMNAILRQNGEVFVRRLIDEVVAECGVFRVNAQIVHAACEGDD